MRYALGLANRLHKIGKFAVPGKRHLSLDWVASGWTGKSERELSVSAVAAAESLMVAEDRIARLESDVGELKGDVKALNALINGSMIANAKEFGGLKTEMEKGFGTLRTEIERNRADTEKGFGSLGTSIESAKLWMLVTGVGSVILVTFVTFLGHALKLL
jgi:hypothetical protein